MKISEVEIILLEPTCKFSESKFCYWCQNNREVKDRGGDSNKSSLGRLPLGASTPSGLAALTGGTRNGYTHRSHTPSAWANWKTRRARMGWATGGVAGSLSLRYEYLKLPCRRRGLAAMNGPRQGGTKGLAGNH